MRGKVEIETLRSEREAIIVTEIPYQVNKAHAGRAHRRAGAREAASRASPTLRDESDRDGMRVVIELQARRDAPTWCSTSSTASPRCSRRFGANMVALNGGRPQLMNLKDLLAPSSPSARRSSTRRTKFLLEQGARPRPCPGRPRHRGRQYRRGDPPHPRRAGRQRRRARR